MRWRAWYAAVGALNSICCTLPRELTWLRPAPLAPRLRQGSLFAATALATAGSGDWARGSPAHAAGAALRSHLEGPQLAGLQLPPGQLPAAQLPAAVLSLRQHLQASQPQLRQLGLLAPQAQADAGRASDTHAAALAAETAAAAVAAAAASPASYGGASTGRSASMPGALAAVTRTAPFGGDGTQGGSVSIGDIIASGGLRGVDLGGSGSAASGPEALPLLSAFGAPFAACHEAGAGLLGPGGGPPPHRFAARGAPPPQLSPIPPLTLPPIASGSRRSSAPVASGGPATEPPPRGQPGSRPPASGHASSGAAQQFAARGAGSGVRAVAAAAAAGGCEAGCEACAGGVCVRSGSNQSCAEALDQSFVQLMNDALHR